MKKYFIAIIIILGALSSYAQQPVISSISTIRGFDGDRIEISGSGFSANPANLIIRFGAMNGTILTSTNNFIEALVPIGTTLSSISVTHKTSNLTGYSGKDFYLTFSGETTDAISVATRTTFSSNKELFDLVIVDLDEDGKNDVVATKIDPTSTDIVIYRNAIVSNNFTFDENSFEEQSQFIGNPTVNIGYGDIDGDGKVDLVLSRGGNSNRNQIYVLRNTSTVGTISFAAAKSYFLPSGHLAKKTFIRDLDLDGKPEVVVSNTFNNQISIFKNSSTPGSVNLSFTPTLLDINGATTTNGLSIGDLDSDGRPDLVLTQFLDNDIFIVPNVSVDGNLIFGDQHQITLPGNLNNISVADLNFDGHLDILATMPVQTKLAILKNEGTGFSFTDAETLDTGLNCWGIGLGDYTGNGNADVVVTSSSGNTFAFFKNISTGGNIELTLTKTDIGQTLKTRNAAIGDVNGDAKPDLVFTTFSSTTSELLVIRNTTCIEPLLAEDDLSASICNGQPPYRFNVAPAEGVTFIWKKSGAIEKNSLDPFYETDQAGSYTVTAVSESGSCTFESPPFSLTVNTGGLPNDPVASNGGIGCIGSDALLFSTDVSGATFSWTGPNGFTSPDQNPTLPNMTANMAGKYTVVALLGPCKSAESSTIVEVITPPDFTIVASGPTIFCAGNTITLTVAAEPGYSYAWEKDSAPFGGTTNTLDITEAGDYQAIVSSVSCILKSNLLTASTFPIPTPSFTTGLTLCIDKEVSFTNTTSIEAGQIPIYTWDFGDGTTSNEENPVHTFATAEAHSVTFIVDYEGQSCLGSTPQTVTIANPEAISIAPVEPTFIPFCIGENAQILANGNFVSYLWNTTETTSAITVETAGYYSVEATSSSGCVTKDSIEIITNALPIIIATANPDTVQLGQNSQLMAEGAFDYSWTPEEGLDDPSSDSPIATLTIASSFMVTGTDENGCVSTAEVSIFVNDTGDKLPVTAAVAFSPNGDGIDDTWVIAGIENFPDCELVIFDRSGRIVFTKMGYNNDWNGMDEQGNQLPVGAYFYTISCTDAKTDSGSVSIIR